MPALHNKSGTLTRYGLACGYMEKKASLKNDDYLTLSLDCIYHVKGYKQKIRIWESFDTLTAARQFYRSIRIR